MIAPVICFHDFSLSTSQIPTELEGYAFKIFCILFCLMDLNDYVLLPTTD